MYITHVAVFVILSLILSGVPCGQALLISDEEYKILPPIFHIDDYEKCNQGNKQFCKITIKLSPIISDNGNMSKIWDIIQATTKSNRHYKHDELFHGICLNDYNYTSGDPAEFVSGYYNKKYQNLGLHVKITQIDCRNYDNIYKLETLDICLLLFVVLGLALTFLATILDFQCKSSESNKFIFVLSLRNSYAKLITNYQQIKGQKLKCIQGFRFYTTLLIIFTHTFCSFIGGYVENTQYLEDIPLNSARHLVRTWFAFLVQTFFLVSAWLLSYYTCQVIEKTKNLEPIKYFFLTFINRYLRIIPPILFMISITASSWILGYFYGPVKDIYSDRECQMCRSNWLPLVLFISNHYKETEMCYFITWYLSADTQLYLISLIILVLTWKFPKKVITIFTACLAIGILLPTIVTFVYNLDIIYRITPEHAKNSLFLSFEFTATYSSTFTNTASYMLGLLFGYLYHQYEKMEVDKKRGICSNPAVVTLWWISIIGLPLTAVTLASFTYENKFMASVVAGILRPMYALGVGVAIFGMSQKLGGPLRRVFEWEPVLFLGNITYSTYVVQFGIVFYRTALAKRPLYVTDFVLMKSFVHDAIFSFICGFLMHLLLEIPCSKLQNLLVPKLGSSKIKDHQK